MADDGKAGAITWGAAAAAAAPVLDTIVNGLFQSGINKKQREFEAGQAFQQREWNEKMFQKQNDFNLEMWQLNNEYNSPEKQVQRMREAGLNPLFYGLDGSSASAVQSAQLLGYDRASLPNLKNPYNGGLSNIVSSMKDVELKNAQIDKLKEDSSSLHLDNEFKERTLNARVEAEDLKNSISKKQMSLIDKQIDEASQRIKESVARTDNEIEKKLLIQSETNLRNVQAQQIVELLPYEKLLKSAQTIAQKAAAAASFAKAAIDNKLLDEGAVDAMIDEYKAKAKDAEARAALDQFKKDVHTGHIFDLEGHSLPYKAAGTLFNELFNTIGVVSEAILGPIAGLIGKAL